MRVSLQVTLGLPFYGRFLEGGDWRSYEDLAARGQPEADLVPWEGRQIALNAPATIAAKTSYAAAKGAGGVMIWEVGQDCRLWMLQYPHSPKNKTRILATLSLRLLHAI